MDELDPNVAQRLAKAVIAFEQRRTGHAPRSVNVALSENTLVITLHGALSPAERAVAGSAAGAAPMQELYRQLFANSADALRREIQRITGVEVLEAGAEVEAGAGGVMQMFPTGTVVQVFRLARSVPAATWSVGGPGGQS
jgi:uncharacterized protein YbcI